MKRGIIQNLYRYPIKGLSAEPLESVDLQNGSGFPLDRALGFARPGSGFDPENPKPLEKTKFVVLARDAGLATLTHTPNPMKFLNELCDRPSHEKPMMVLVVGKPAADATIPVHATIKKPLDQITSWL